MGELLNTIQLFDKYASIYQEKYMDVSLYRTSLNLFCELIKENSADILELGCGPGNITKYLLTTRPDLKILATDLSVKMLELAKVNNPKAETQLMDCRNLKDLKKEFNAIMCAFCLPYLNKEDSIKLIEDSFQVLKSQGILYISTMEDDYEKSGIRQSQTVEKDSTFTYYHQEDYLQNSLQNCGFELLESSKIVYSAADNSLITDLILLAKKP